jgi:prepilin-type N-terminal cleavage/methylation domain-containing protein
MLCSKLGVRSSEFRVDEPVAPNFILHPSSFILATRRGFTLVELLVVAAIMLLLAAAAAPVALTLLNGRSLREASSSVQAMIAGARDRASAARDARGIRLIPDADDPSIVREIRFIRPSVPLSSGSAIVADAVWNAPWNDFSVPFPTGATNGPTVSSSSWIADTAPPANPQFSLVVLMGCTDGIKLRSLPYRMAGTTRVYFGVIRLATSGQLLGFSTTDALITNTVGGDPYPLLRLDKPLTRPYPYNFQRAGQLPYRSGYSVPAGMQARDYLAEVGDEYKIPIGTVELEGEQPQLLPAGVVIDLGYIDPTAANAPDPSGVRLSRLQPEYTNWDILFSPTGAVIGSASAEAHIFLWLREEAASVQDVQVAPAVAPSQRLRLIPTNNTGNHAIVAIVSRTGLIRSVEPNFGAMQGGSANATMDIDGVTTGANLPYWNRFKLYDLFYSEINAPDGGETGL